MCKVGEQDTLRLQFGGWERYEDIDIWPYYGPWVSYVKPGIEFYLLDIYFTNTGKSRRDARTEPAHKNMSGERCVYGWCGTTDNVDVNAFGRWRVDDVIEKHGNSFYTVLATRVE